MCSVCQTEFSRLWNHQNNPAAMNWPACKTKMSVFKFLKLIAKAEEPMYALKMSDSDSDSESAKC